MRADYYRKSDQEEDLFARCKGLCKRVFVKVSTELEAQSILVAVR